MLIETEMNCSDIRWSVPVPVRTPKGRKLDVCGPQEAMNVLAMDWPKDERGEHYERARKLCMAAMGRRVPAETMRDDFIEACLEAGLYCV
ncbi:hypothetical protein QO002_002164 [Pararhizobium capsulatum DSM 1112]|uniref:DUF982 domain-containing protein n=1 Tax=Pararhizobium capsulatum DSM 1112 TaxID=1121113 RepID=A0ABU0BP41_9HYPH|nr:DUF982 domain-containing protein [Pararhizobium capsulatum]MDQ0320026.1 hypothetical protein [Pararhizobium capsulatum DSM 1112]